MVKASKKDKLEKELESFKQIGVEVTYLDIQKKEIKRV